MIASFKVLRHLREESLVKKYPLRGTKQFNRRGRKGLRRGHRVLAHADCYCNFLLRDLCANLCVLCG